MHLNRLILLYFIFSLCQAPIFAELPSCTLPEEIRTFDLLAAPGKLVQANASYLDEEGWLHFYDKKNQFLILSIKTEGQEIGDLDDRLRISTGLLATYGKMANDLSGADYIQNSIWLTMNRYWRIQHASEVNLPVKVRFYFDTQDFEDLQAGIAQAGYSVETVKDIKFYALEGASIHPFSTHTKRSKAQLNMQEDRKTQFTIGQVEDYYYAEFQLKDLKSSGSGGVLVPLKEKRFRVAGTIQTPGGQPIENAFLKSGLQKAIIRSTEDGEYIIANLQGGENFEVKPYIPNRPAEGVTVLDMIALSNYLKDPEKISDPYQILAADFDQSGKIDSNDLAFVRALVLGGLPGLNMDAAWHFIPASLPLKEDGSVNLNLPESIRLSPITKDESDLNFIAVKNGNIWEEQAFPNDPPLLLDPNFYFDDKQSCGAGELISFDLNVSDFEGIRGFQFSIGWDTAVLEFVDVVDFDLPEFDKRNIGYYKTEAGILTFAWYASQYYKSLKRQDQSSVCKIRFRVVGKNDSFSTLNFIDYPTPYQVLRRNLSASNVLFTLGSVQVKNNSTLELVDAKVKDISCYAKTDGRITVIVNGGEPPYRYEWSNGSHRSTAANLKAGSYQVTVSDGKDCPLISKTFEIKEPGVIYLANEKIRQPKCAGIADGAISFKTLGGSPPYDYQWNNLSKTPWIGQLNPGTYSVTVSDSKGCETDATFEIENPGEIFVNYSITHASETDKDDGIIRIRDLIKIPGPHLYEWSNGRKLSGNPNLAPGSYTVTISSGNGCKYEFDYLVDREEPPLELSVHLKDHAFLPGSYQPLEIKSPISQTIKYKIFDQHSNLKFQQVIAAQSGFNLQYFKTPNEPGTYMMQVHPQSGGVRSLRFIVK